jgi:hypothetical protein
MSPSELFKLFPARQGTWERGNAIFYALKALKDRVAVRPQMYHSGRNFFARVGQPKDGTPVLEAHYDVANAKSENCLDNTASVCHLLALAHDPDFHGFLAFCDGEELCSFALAGSAQLGRSLVVEDAWFWGPSFRPVLCLELTGVGEVIWVDDPRGHKFGPAEERPCPFNDAHVLRDLGLEAVQVSITPDDQFDLPVPPNWRYCHSIEDKFSLAVESDMLAFQAWLKGTQ